MAAASSAPASRSAPWCTCTASSGREALRLPLPVPDQGHRTDQQGWRRRVIRNGRVLRVVRPQQREELDGLSQAHVVGEDGADAEPARGTTARKARAAGRAGGCRGSPRASGLAASRSSAWPDSRSPSQPSASTVVERRGRRACRRSPGPRRAPRPRSSSPTARARGTSARPSGAGRRAPPTGRGRGRAGPCAGELGQLRRGQHVVAEGQVVAEVHQVLQAELARPAGGGGPARRGPGGQLAGRAAPCAPSPA